MKIFLNNTKVVFASKRKPTPIATHSFENYDGSSPSNIEAIYGGMVYENKYILKLSTNPPVGSSNNKFFGATKKDSGTWGNRWNVPEGTDHSVEIMNHYTYDSYMYLVNYSGTPITCKVALFDTTAMSQEDKDYIANTPYSELVE